jgi:(p)ppGpp synthase/HD superfamily hydrolase
MNPKLEDAIIFAARAHRGQKDKSGKPYVLHSLRVMLRLEDETAQMAAVLHDVVEDTGVTLDQLRAAGFNEEVCEAVDCLTRRPGEPYEELIRRAAGNPIARRIKLADLEDNMDPRRRLPGEGEARKQARYHAARASLMAAN